MRKLTATQIAAMAATLGVYANNVAKYGIPLAGLLPATTHADDDGTELDEVIVTGVRQPGAWDVFLYPPILNPPPITPPGGGGTPTAPVAQAPSNANTSPNRNALRCAARFSINADVNPNGGGGQAPTYQTSFVTGWYWGTDDINSPAPPIPTPTNQSPGPGYHRVLGWTSPVNRVSYIYTTNVSYDATQLGIPFQNHLVNTLGHEWSHQWNPFYPDESEPDRLGDLTQQLFEQAGGTNGQCWTMPPHYGNGPRK